MKKLQDARTRMVHNFESAKTVSEKKEIMLLTMADFIKNNWGKYKILTRPTKLKLPLKNSKR